MWSNLIGKKPVDRPRPINGLFIICVCGGGEDVFKKGATKWFMNFHDMDHNFQRVSQTNHTPAKMASL